MGYGVTYICKKCKQEKMIFYGTGFDDYNYQSNNFKKLVELGRQEHLQNLNQLLSFIKLENVYLKNNYRHDAYIWPKCKNIHNKFRYTLLANNNRFHPRYKCDYCGGNLRIKKEKEDFTITCDNCKNNNFEKTPTLLMWD